MISQKKSKLILLEGKYVITAHSLALRGLVRNNL